MYTMLAALVISLTLPLKAPAYFLRHAETVANATGLYVPRNIDTFSDRGEQQVKDLVPQLSRMRFQLILVSPSPRALRTIAPWLEKTHQRGIVWPLLYECCTGKRPKHASPTHFAYGGLVKVPKNLQHLFLTMRDESRMPVATDYNAGLAQVQACVKEFRARWQDQQPLLVGHSGQGGQFIHELTGKWLKLDNGKLYRIRN